MKALLKERRWGKSTALLKEAKKQERSLVMSFNHTSTKYLRLQAMDLFKDEVECYKQMEHKIVFKNGNEMVFIDGIQCLSRGYNPSIYIEHKMYIDEMPLMIERILGKHVEMFTGTCEEYGSKN